MRRVGPFLLALLLLAAGAVGLPPRIAIITDFSAGSFAAEWADALLAGLAQPRYAGLLGGVAPVVRDDRRNATRAAVLAREVKALGCDVIFAAFPTLTAIRRELGAEALVFAPKSGEIALEDGEGDGLLLFRPRTTDEVLGAVNWFIRSGSLTFALVASSYVLATTSVSAQFVGILATFGASPHDIVPYPSADAVPEVIRHITEGLLPPDVILFLGDPPASRAFARVAHSSGVSCVLSSLSHVQRPEVPQGVRSTGRLFGILAVPPHWSSTTPPQVYESWRVSVSAGLADGTHSYEGFLVGSFLGEVLRDNPLADASDWCPNCSVGRALELFIQERQHVTTLPGGVVLGPWGATDRCNATCRGTSAFATVSLAEYDFEASTWQSIRDSAYRWECCDSTSGPLKLLSIFGKSADKSGVARDVGNALDYGILTALKSWKEGPTALLTSVDDQYNTTISLRNVQNLIHNKSVLGFLCCLGTGPAEAVVGPLAEMKIPYVAPFTGSDKLHSPASFIREVVNVRPSYSCEVATLCGFALDTLGAKRFAGTFVDMPVGNVVMDDVNRYLCSRGRRCEAQWNFSFGGPASEKQAIAQKFVALKPDVVLVIGMTSDALACLEALKALLPITTVYEILSIADPRAVVSGLQRSGRDISNLFFSEIVPSWEDESLPLVREFNSLVPEPKRNWATLEGYIGARFALEILKEMQSDPSNTDKRASLLKHVYSGRVYNISGFTLGPFKDWPCGDPESCHKHRCNTGSKTVWLIHPTVGPAASVVTYPVMLVSVYEPCGVEFGPPSCGLEFPRSSSSGDGLTLLELLGYVVGPVVVVTLAIVVAAVLLYCAYARHAAVISAQRRLRLADVSIGGLVSTAHGQAELLSVEELFEPSRLTSCSLSNLGISVSTGPVVTFAQEDDEPVVVNCPVSQAITVSLLPRVSSSSKLELSVHLPLPSPCRYTLSFAELLARSSSQPLRHMRIVVRANQPATFSIWLVAHCTLRVRTEFYLESKRSDCCAAVPVEAHSALSMFLDPQEITLENHVLGAGPYAKVLKGQWRGIECAVKVLNCQVLTAAERDEFVRELDILNKCRHPNIVNFVGGVVVPSRFCVLTELVKMGNLSSVLETEFLSSVLKLRIASDVARGMTYLHESNVIHRDLKPANILVVSLSLRSAVVAKISDLGSCRHTASRDQDRTFTQAVGTPIYEAPEVLMGKLYSNKCDVFSFAVMLWELMTEQEPYRALASTWEIAAFVSEGKRLPMLSEGGKTVPPGVRFLISKCWEQDPAARPSFREVIVELDILRTSAADSGRHGIPRKYSGRSNVRRKGLIKQHNSSS